MKKKIIIPILMMLALLLGMISYAPVAGAHTPSVKADCNGVVVKLTSYGNANVKVTVGGTVVEDKTFSGNFAGSYPVPQEGAETTYSVVVDERRDGNQYDKSYNGKVGPCGEEKKTDLCHATGSEKNPFVKINVSVSAAFSGHMGSGHQKGEDIIPPFVYKGTTYSQNWDNKGQETYNNDCVVKVITPVPPTPQPPTPQPPVCDDECKIPYVKTDAPKVTTCRGVLDDKVLNNVFVPAGFSCTLVDTHVNGSVKAKGARSLTMADTTIRGDVKAFKVEDLTFGSKGHACRFDPFIGGNLYAKKGHNVLICQASVCGKIVVEKNDGKITVRDSRAKKTIIRKNTEFVADGSEGHNRPGLIRIIDVDGKKLIKFNAPRLVYVVGAAGTKFVQ